MEPPLVVLRAQAARQEVEFGVERVPLLRDGLEAGTVSGHKDSQRVYCLLDLGVPGWVGFGRGFALARARAPRRGARVATRELPRNLGRLEPLKVPTVLQPATVLKALDGVAEPPTRPNARRPRPHHAHRHARRLLLLLFLLLVDDLEVVLPLLGPVDIRHPDVVVLVEDSKADASGPRLPPPSLALERRLRLLPPAPLRKLRRPPKRVVPETKGVVLGLPDVDWGVCNALHRPGQVVQVHFGRLPTFATLRPRPPRAETLAPPPAKRDEHPDPDGVGHGLHHGVHEQRPSRDGGPGALPPRLEARGLRGLLRGPRAEGVVLARRLEPPALPLLELVVVQVVLHLLVPRPAIRGRPLVLTRDEGLRREALLGADGVEVSRAEASCERAMEPPPPLSVRRHLKVSWKVPPRSERGVLPGIPVLRSAFARRGLVLRLQFGSKEHVAHVAVVVVVAPPRVPPPRPQPGARRGRHGFGQFFWRDPSRQVTARDNHQFQSEGPFDAEPRYGHDDVDGAGRSDDGSIT